MSQPTKVDVLVIGAGPAGVVCANSLVKSGLKVKIIDHAPPKTVGHGDGIYPRTIELIHSYGLGPQFFKEACPVHSFALYAERPNGKGIENTDYQDCIDQMDARWRYSLTISQGGVENLFRQSMAKEGVTIDRPVKPISIDISTDPAVLEDHTAYPVQAVLQRMDGDESTEEVHARLVLGADGAHSWVRKQLGISMDGAATSRVWGAIDFAPDQVPELFPDWRRTSTIVSGERTILLIPREEDKIRLYVELGDATVVDEVTGRAETWKAGPEKLLGYAAKAFAPFTIGTADLKKVEWWTNYIIGQRVASHFNVGQRAFIAGDACHTHSPKGGQGMNVSMNDSHNLAWKMAYFLKGWGTRALLSTYEEERRPIAKALIAFDKVFSARFSAKARAELATAEGQKELEPLEGFRDFSGLTSGIGIVYEPSLLVSETPAQSPATGVTLGKRVSPRVIVNAADSHPVNLHDLCPADGRFKILVFTGDLTGSEQAERCAASAKALAGEQGILRSYSDFDGMFKIISIMQNTAKKLPYGAVPKDLWTHWSQVFVDETSIADPGAGICYETFGVGSEGAIVVVRPDNHVGSVHRLDETAELEQYFNGFLVRK
jgi:phenol 2-monooxygenase